MTFSIEGGADPIRPVYGDAPVAVTGISLNKTSMTLTEGATQTLTATITPSNATNKNVTWSSSKTLVATVDANGKVTAVKAGTATITAKTADGGKTATCTVTVSAVAVTGISLNRSSYTMDIGGTMTLTATVLPSNATNKTVSWSTSNSSVATVSNGVVTAEGAGTATITAKTADGGKTATCTVTVEPIKVTGVSLNKTALSIFVGDIQMLLATILPSNATNKSVIWTSSNTSVATVDATGKVKAIKVGTATITARTADGGYTAECCATVKAYPVPELVDLGLSVKWATCNLGATRPEQSGGYYQWAGLEDVTDKSINLLSNCPYHTGSDYLYGHTKYVPSNESLFWSGSGSPDNKTVLDPEDDVAHVKLGGKWRMPTDAEWAELRDKDNCTWTWTTQNGVKGYKVTSKKTGYRNNSIFLPAAGHRNDTGLAGVGSYGSYWSPSLNTSYPYLAYYLSFDSSGVYRSDYGRYDGLSVRPVSE